MAIQFVLGPSGSGKSKYLRKLIIDQSLEKSDKKFLYVVPDQFNMYTQRQMILEHPDHAFTNIEVLSFSRLSHRVLEEVGGEDIPVLDDTGKSLIIRHVAETLKDDLEIMGDKLGRIGYVHEVKSAISEFLQYGISPDDVQSLTECAGGRKALAVKLRDLEKIYRAFLQYKSDNYLTREETLDLVKDGLHKSSIIKNAFIVFDGFTGFTPIQERVIQELMILADQVIFSLVLDGDMDPYSDCSEQELFRLSIQTVKRIKKMADEASVSELPPIFMPRLNAEITGRSVELAHLEENLFRYPARIYTDKPKNIQIFQAVNIRQEINDTCDYIARLTRQGDYCYRDIAIVVGSIEDYADSISEITADWNIPVYMDYSRSIMQSPLVEAIRAALDVYESDYSRESICRFLRTGFGGFVPGEVDELENYLLRTGIRGIRSFEKMWTLRDRANSSGVEEDAERILQMNRLNNYRERILEQFRSLHNIENLKTNINKNSKAPTCELNRALRDFCEKAGMSEHLNKLAEYFYDMGDSTRASEYTQIYAKVIALWEQIDSLMGDEIVSLGEYREILESGFGEIKLGMIPQKNDTITVGDITRSRLADVKIVFMLGVNDSNIPGKISTGGIISDMDREFLVSNSDKDFAPTPREQMFTQRLYLYMNMCKPVDKLVLSFAQMDAEGSSLRPSYLITTLCKLYKELNIASYSESHMVGTRVMPIGQNGVKLECAAMMREYVTGQLSDELCVELPIYEEVLCKHNQGKVYADIRHTAFDRKRTNPIAVSIARELYGRIITSSVSRLEKFATCEYAHFLSYGLRLKGRSEFGFERRDLGDIYHLVLEEFSHKLIGDGVSWRDFDDDYAAKAIDQIMEELTYVYGENVLISSARTKAIAGRIGRILKRTVSNVQYQIRQGSFEPADIEKKFEYTKEFKEPGDNLGIKVKLVGKIDRIDICNCEGSKALRIVDYKSGNRNFELIDLLYGVSMQLPVYMSAAMDEYGHSLPAGMFYYHIDDPFISSIRNLSDEELLASINKGFRLHGVVCSEDTLVPLHDLRLAGHANFDSDVIPFGYKKDGLVKANSKCLTKDDYDLVLRYSDMLIGTLTSGIMQGNIETNPKSINKKKAPCTYCDYKSICHIDCGAPGYEIEIIDSAHDSEIKDIMHARLGDDSEEQGGTEE